MRYLNDDSGFVVYSIGRNYADDGGILKRDDKQGNPDYENIDIGVRLNTDKLSAQDQPEE